MSSSTQQASDIAASVSKLTITPADNIPKVTVPRSDKKSKKKPVADSWEDEEVSGSDPEDATDLDSSLPSASAGANPGTQAPPPTPITPSYSHGTPFSSALGAVEESKRPEKTDAVARRMIASALGVKVPKQTEDQKAYDKAMREKERRRREDEHEAERKRLEEAEKAKKAIWED